MGPIGNLGPRERRKRWIEAAAALATAVAFMQLVAATALARGLVVLLVALAAFCALQARASTCAILALQGRRNLDHGAEPIDDPTACRRLRFEAWRILGLTLATTVLAACVLAIA